MDEVGDAGIIVRGDDDLGGGFDFRGGVFDGGGGSGPLEHFEVVQPVSDGGDFVGLESHVGGEGLEAGAFVDVGGEELDVVGF